MNKFALTLLVSSLPVFCADEVLPKAETILEHYAEAVGGRAVAEKHRTEVMHGTILIAGPGLKGKMTVYQAAPDKNLSVVEIDGVGKIESGSNGEVAWENSVVSGPKVKQGVERADALRDGTFNSALYWKKLYAKVETTGVETVEGHECYKVVMTPAEGNPATHFYDKQSGLLIKTATTRKTQSGDINAEVIASDYRKEGDMLAPHKMVNKFIGQELQIVVESVEFNVDLPKDRFDLPPEIQALLKKNTPAPALSQASPAPAGTGGKLTIYIGGAAVANETYAVKRSEGRIEVSGSGNAMMGPIKIDIQDFTVVTDDKYQLVGATAKAKMGTVQMNVKTTFADGKAKSEIDTGQGPTNKEEDVHSGAVVVNATFPLYPWSAIAMRADFTNHDPQQFNIYVLGQGEVPGTIVFRGKETVQFAGKTAQLNHLNASGKDPQGKAISLDFWVDENRQVIKISYPAQGVEAYQEGFDRVPTAPKAPAPKE
jgi:hypothetical protein